MIKQITKKDAAALGLKRYFDYTPCYEGHTSERYVSDSSCIDCSKHRAKKRYKKKKAEILESQKLYYAENSQKLKDRVNQRRIDNPEKNKDIKRKEYEKNKQSYIDRATLWRKANPEKHRHSARMWHVKYPIKSYNAVVERRAKLKNRMPEWLTDSNKREILEFYKEARKTSLDTGINYQVDHIVPLRGKNVSGLHVPWNLQILTAYENRSKGNKFVVA
tara:strand:- start:29436 stop:30092 length:657 start_codon:yes stop_codon:yes gene_type:complete